MALPAADLGTRLLDQALAEAAKKNSAQDGATWLAQQLCSHDCPEQLARTVMDKYVGELPQTGKKAAYSATKARSTLREVYAAGKVQIIAWKLAEPPKGQPLTKSDLQKLERSWIDADIAAAACLRRVSDEDGRAIVGADRRRGSMAGIVFPYLWPGTARIREYRLRRDQPDVEISGTKRKEINKYLSPPGRSNMLYFPPATDKSWLQDPSLPILLTEGEKKTLALFRLARTGKYAGFPVRFLPVGLSGVWNWRGTTGKTTGPDGERLDEKGVIADMKRIVWSGRRVLILFDANVRTNESVQSARRELARWLVMESGATVLYADLPEVEGVNGVDDYLAAHGPERTMGVIKRARPCPFRIKVDQEALTEDEKGLPSFSGEKYISDSRGILMWSKPNETGGRMPIWLTNFQAEIKADVEKDDGETKTRAFRIWTKIHGRERDVIVSPTAFSEMTWPLEELGARAIVYPGQKGNAAAGIQKLSKGIVDQYLYQHTGWTKIQEQYVYLHAGGAIGASGAVKDVAVELDREIRRYELPPPPKGRELVEAVRASLRVLNTAPDRVSIPLYCSTWRAVLGVCDSSIHLAGQTGSGKSQEAALVQQHFGRTMDAKHLPASWDSTANALQAISFMTKNAICVIDDFVPKGSAADVARMHRDADRVLRSQGNNSGRLRMTASTDLRGPKWSRGIILSTGEDVPRGNSLRARLVLIEMEPDDMRWDHLTACQRDAAEGLYTNAMSGFIQWLAPKMADMPQRIFQQLSEFREQWGAGGRHHMRTPDNLANLSCGLEVFLEFAREIRAINERDAGALWARALDSFAIAAAEAERSQSHAEPTQQFLTYIAAAIAKGEAHLVSLRGEHPDTPEAAGWKCEAGEWKPLGTRIGWISGETVYLHPENSYAAAQRVGRDVSDTIAISQQTLGMRLKQRGVLLKSESQRRVTTARVSTSTGRADVWWISRSALYAE